jgi:membrane protease YdiL (CAAX protease family)
MRKKVIGIYLVLAFSITWTVWFILAYCISKGYYWERHPLYIFLGLLGGYGPLIAALLAELADYRNYNGFLKRQAKVKCNILWYIGAALMPLALSFVLWICNTLITGKRLLFSFEPVYMLFAALPLNIITAGTEEIGWRGLLLPELLKKLSSFKATIVLSFIWALWHLPLFFTKGQLHVQLGFAGFVLQIISLSFLISIIYNRTKSILLCAIFHASFNSCINIGINNYLTHVRSKYIILAISAAICIGAFLISEHMNKKADIQKEIRSK